jgi:type IV pilus assembly protein PilY1
MRRNKLYPLVALVASAVTPLAAQAQLKDTTWIRPTMMVLVDTSGSMERKPDTASCVDCLPSCNDNAATDERNRWAITLEALTGTFNSYKCTKRDRSNYVGQYDENYFLPHYEFATTSPLFATFATQAADGVLDSWKTRLKFGLMTFDGVSTTVNGATLVPWSSYTSVKSKILGVEGQYSYPDATADMDTNLETPSNAWGWKPLSFPGCLDTYGVNAGARGKGSTPGSLLSVGSSEDATSMATINDDIQTSLLSVRPYAGTPIAAMLDDLRYYMRNDPDINATDPYYACRDHYAVLLTDGAPDAMFRGGTFQCESAVDADCAPSPSTGVKACQCPYDTETSLAAKLRANDKLNALWVVAFNVNDTVALAALDKIAQAGGDQDAYRATDLSTLRSKLSEAFSKSQPDATSRSVPVIINTGRAIMLDGGKQFQITAGFRVSSASDESWEGRLWRQRITCNGAAAEAQALDASKGDIFHTTLNGRDGADRNIVSVRPANTALPYVTPRGTVLAGLATSKVAVSKTNIIKPDGSSFGPLTEVEPPSDLGQTTVDTGLSLTAFDGSMPTTYWSGNATTRDNINAYLRGTSANDYRSKHKLGDIYHSNPVAIPPIFPGSDVLSAYDPQLRSFYLNLIDTTKSGGYWGNYGATGRPGVVFVATNDGILHAFNLDDWTDKAGVKYGAGYEFWGFVPPATFNMLPAVVSPSHQFVFDGTPVVKDLILSKPVSGGTAKLSTILIAAVRGLPAYVALDVTWPEKPVFLWQRSFAYLGETVATPALADVKVRWNGVDQIRAVAILPGGNGTITNAGSSCPVNVYTRGKPANGTARDNVRCWSLRGRSLYVVDVETGELIQEFDGRHFHSAMTGSVAVDGEELSVSRAAYMTDADGVLWRLSMLNSDPSKWRVVPIWDLYGGTATDFAGNTVSTTSPDWKMGRAASYPPVVNRDPVTGNLTIVVGTGDVDNLTDTAANRVVSINETRNIDSYGELSSGTLTANWKLQLDAGESVTGPMLVLNNTLYFTSFTSPGNTTDKCALGVSRIVGGDIRKSYGNLPVAGLSPEGGGAFILQYKPSTASNSLLLGLNISRDPVCVAGTVSNDPLVAGNPGRVNPSQQGGGTYQLRSMVAGSGGTVMSGSNGDDKGQRQFTRAIPIPTVARSVGWASSIE